MKYIKKIATITLAASFSISAAHADVKNQTDIIKERLSVGDYGTIAGGSSAFERIAEILPDKAQSYGHLHVIVQPYPSSATESTRNTKVNYFADNVAFPVTYRQNVYEGNAKLQKKIGYTLRRGPFVNKSRLVVVDDYIFLLNDWKNKDDYTLKTVLKIDGDNAIGSRSGTTGLSKSSGFGGFLGALTKSMGQVAAGDLDGNGEIQNLKATVLQPYLDQATIQQQSYFAKWKQKPANAKHLKYLADMEIAMDEGMKNYNQEIYNSPAHQRMLAHHRWMAKNVDMKVYNKKGINIWIGTSENAFITTKVDAGSDAVGECNEDSYYYFSEKRGTPGTKFNSAGDNCGGSVTIR